MYCKIPLKDITKIAIVVTNCKKSIAEIKKEQGCQYIINGGLYSFSNHKPFCKLKVNNKILAEDKYGYWMYCWDTGNDIKMVHSNDMYKYKNGIAVVALLKDNKHTILTYDAALGGRRGRSAIGLNNNDLILYCTPDGTKEAETPEVLRNSLERLGCLSAIMLDSGGSSSCDFNGKKVASARKVHNYICVWTNESIKNPYSIPLFTVKEGSHGNGVRWVQWWLQQKGYNCGGIDGAFGKMVKNAVMKFQKNNNLTVDGIVGKQTREKLKQ